MANQWFRMYSEFATDPKVQMLSEADQRRYMMLLCLRCSNGDVTLHETEVAFQLRISNEEWAATKAVLVQKNLIDEDNKPCAWDKRQYTSDSSAARVAAYRERKKRVCNVTVTPPDTDTDTDTEEEKEQKALVPSGDDTAGYSAEFEACWKAYPARSGGNSKKAAGKAWNARIRSGVSADDLARAVERYAAELRAKGKIGTEFVKQASTFFGPDEHWKSYATAQLVQFTPGVLREGYFFHPDDNGLPREQRRQLSRETHDPATGYRLDYLKSRGLA